eukprot:1247557-Ditylum_brightwellii.AAC.1
MLRKAHEIYCDSKYGSILAPHCYQAFSPKPPKTLSHTRNKSEICAMPRSDGRILRQKIFHSFPDWIGK